MLRQYNQPQPATDTVNFKPTVPATAISAEAQITVLEQQIQRQARKIRQLESEIQQITSHLRRSDR